VPLQTSGAKHGEERSAKKKTARKNNDVSNHASMMRLNKCVRREDFFPHLPEDKEALKAMFVLCYRNATARKRAEEQAKRANDLHVEKLRCKWSCAIQEVDLRAAGRSLECGELMQMLLDFARDWSGNRSARTMCRCGPNPSTNCGE